MQRRPHEEPRRIPRQVKRQARGARHGLPAPQRPRELGARVRQNARGLRTQQSREGRCQVHLLLPPDNRLQPVRVRPERREARAPRLHGVRPRVGGALLPEPRGRLGPPQGALRGRRHRPLRRPRRHQPDRPGDRQAPRRGQGFAPEDPARLAHARYGRALGTRADGEGGAQQRPPRPPAVARRAAGPRGGPRRIAALRDRPRPRAPRRARERARGRQGRRAQQDARAQRGP